MPAQSGLLHTWSHLRKMKTSLQRFLASDSENVSQRQHVHLPSFFGQITDRGVNIGSALKIRFLAQYDDRLPLVIRANADLLRRAVSLMLDYAMDRHPGVGYTTFAVQLAEESDRDYVSFDVWHSGVSRGGDKGMRSWFSRDEMEELATRMGGHFLATDPHGMEARYAVRITLIPGDPSLVEQTPPATTGQVYAENGVTALVVDDSPISRALGVYLLSWHNIEAEAVERGQAAFEKLSAERYDLIFMEYSLPKLDGFQSAAMLREKARPQAGLIVGMYPGAGSAEDMKITSIQAGMQGCLAKPVDPRALNHVLQELLPRVYAQNAGGPDPSRTRRSGMDRVPPRQTGAPDAMLAAQQSLVRELSGIVGLHAEKGLVNTGGNVDIYVGMLQRFTAELNDSIEPLLVLPSGEAWEETALRLHVLREFFAGIGAEKLAREAAVLAADAAAEVAGGTTLRLKQDGVEGWLPRIRGYCDAMMRLRAGLAGLHDKKIRAHAAERSEQEWKRTDPEDLVKLNRYVSRLREACLSHRAAEAGETAAGLRRMAVREDMEEHITAVCRLIDTLDYHEAGERCAHLLTLIKMHRSGTAGENG
ncbi:MAG: response regulator [Deltaproteobacteria bacterium]|jgi:CheY-like chemotaxis protein|nr:response regulator [Deltaproteobacteria bacterium]